MYHKMVFTRTKASSFPSVYNKFPGDLRCLTKAIICNSYLPLLKKMFQTNTRKFLFFLNAYKMQISHVRFGKFYVFPSGSRKRTLEEKKRRETETNAERQTLRESGFNRGSLSRKSHILYSFYSTKLLLFKLYKDNRLLTRNSF